MGIELLDDTHLGACFKKKHDRQRFTPQKTNMTMESQSFEDASSIRNIQKNGDFPASHVSFQGRVQCLNGDFGQHMIDG